MARASRIPAAGPVRRSRGDAGMMARLCMPLPSGMVGSGRRDRRHGPRLHVFPTSGHRHALSSLPRGESSKRDSGAGSAGIGLLQVGALVVARGRLIQRGQLIGALAPAVVQEAALVEAARAATVAAMLRDPELAV